MSKSTEELSTVVSGIVPQIGCLTEAERAEQQRIYRELAAELIESGLAAAEAADTAAAIMSGRSSKFAREVIEELAKATTKAARNRIIKAARERGVNRFWAAERERLRRGEPGSRKWTQEQITVRTFSLASDLKMHPGRL